MISTLSSAEFRGWYVEVSRYVTSGSLALLNGDISSVDF